MEDNWHHVAAVFETIKDGDTDLHDATESASCLVEPMRPRIAVLGSMSMFGIHTPLYDDDFMPAWPLVADEYTMVCLMMARL